MKQYKLFVLFFMFLLLVMILLNSFFRKEVKNGLQHIKKQFIWISLLLGFFLFLLHFFVGIVYTSSQITSTLHEKMGMFFYIKDYDGVEDQIYSAVIHLQSEIENMGMEVSFVSKEEALHNLLGNRNLSLIDTLQDVGIGNPLPASLYVTFDSEEDLLSLKKVLIPYRNIITNVGSITSLNSLKGQEERNLRIIYSGRMIQYISYIIMLGLIVAIITLLLYFVRSLVGVFDEDIVVKKELGVLKGGITFPLVVISSFLMISSWIVMLVFSLCFSVLLSEFIFSRFDFSLVSMLWGFFFVLVEVGLGELLALIILSRLMTWLLVYKRLS